MPLAVYVIEVIIGIVAWRHPVCLFFWRALKVFSGDDSVSAVA